MELVRGIFGRQYDRKDLISLASRTKTGTKQEFLRHHVADFYPEVVQKTKIG